MGTSQSSKGSPSGVPMVPPWVPDIPQIPAAPDNAPTTEQVDAEPSPQKIPIAPPRRFQGANRNLGEYARSGDAASMCRGLGQYVKKGYGGSSTATRRMGGTVQTANALYLAVSSGVDSTGESLLDSKLVSGKSAEEVMDAIIEAVRPIDGTQDAEASRTSIKDALSEVLNQFPDADLVNLQVEQRELAIEQFVAADVFKRIDLDVGRTIREKAPDYTSGLGRLKEVKNYVREVVSASFRRLKSAGQRLTGGRVTQIVQSAIHETFQVFEGYAE